MDASNFQLFLLLGVFISIFLSSEDFPSKAVLWRSCSKPKYDANLLFSILGVTVISIMLTLTLCWKVSYCYHCFLQVWFTSKLTMVTTTLIGSLLGPKILGCGDSGTTARPRSGLIGVLSQVSVPCWYDWAQAVWCRGLLYRNILSKSTMPLEEVGKLQSLSTREASSDRESWVFLTSQTKPHFLARDEIDFLGSWSSPNVDHYLGFSGPCVPSEDNANLTAVQKEPLLWHWKLCVSMGRVQELMCPRDMKKLWVHKVYRIQLSILVSTLLQLV